MNLKPTRPNPLHVPPPSPGEIVAGALGTGFVGGIFFSILAVLPALAVGVFRGLLPDFASLLATAGWFFAAGFVLSVAWGLLKRSRDLMNKAFTLTGFLATFFGLGMLVIFFFGLFQDVAEWFAWTPTLVEIRNQKTLQVREELKKVEQLRDEKKQEIDKLFKETMDAAATEEEKKETLKAFLGDPEKLKVLEGQEKEELAKAKGEANKKAIWEKFDMSIREVGGVYAESLHVLDATIADRKALADMPLRETSTWACLMHFLFQTPSNEPESVGIKPALLGSLWLAAIMILFAVPVGVGAALYLEEYRPKGWMASIIQTNINNLAGVPSIVFGILGAFVFVELIFKPFHRLHEGISVRNVLGGGVTLGLLTLPVVTVSAQEAIRAVPNSLRQGAFALGATKWQVVWNNVLPLARPGILTGTILAVSRAIGEAAPLVLFGATTFIAYSPTPFTDFTVLPIQIFNWAERPTNPTVDGQLVEIWHYNVALASLVLLLMLLVLNAVAIYMRNRAQKKVRW